MPTVDEILLFLVKHAAPDRYWPVEDAKEGPLVHPLEDILLRASGKGRFTVPRDQVETFLGESWDFEKHGREIHEAGWLVFNSIPEKGDFYDTPEYRQSRAKVAGCIGGPTSADPAWVAFRFREDDVLSWYCAVAADAKRWKLKGRRPRRTP